MNCLFKWLLRDINGNVKYSLSLTPIKHKQFMFYKSVFAFAIFTGYILSRPLQIYLRGKRERKKNILLLKKEGKWVL